MSGYDANYDEDYLRNLFKNIKESHGEEGVEMARELMKLQEEVIKNIGVPCIKQFKDMEKEMIESGMPVDMAIKTAEALQLMVGINIALNIDSVPEELIKSQIDAAFEQRRNIKKE